MMSDKAAQRLVSGRAWDDFCDSIKRAGHVVDRFKGLTELDHAEYYRFLTRYLRWGLSRFVEAAEPGRHRFVEMAWRQSINFTSPLQDHFFADVTDHAATYRITGNRGTCPYFIIAATTTKRPADIAERDWAGRGPDGLKEFDPALIGTVDALMSEGVKFDKDGNFSITVSRDQPADGSDWLPLKPETNMILVRTVFAERKGSTPATMFFERVGGPPPTPIRAADISEALTMAAQNLTGWVDQVRDWWDNIINKAPNTVTFSGALYQTYGGISDRHHGFGSWARDTDEALVIRFTPPQCEYWTFQFCNIWQENFDNVEDGQGYLYKDGTKLERDGSVLFVFADRDPGLGIRWVDSYGHIHGGWSFRLIKSGPPPKLYVHRVKLDALKRDGLAALHPKDAIVSGHNPD